MLRFGGRTADDRKVIGLMLSRENVERLKGGEPVCFDGRSVGAEDVVVLLHVTDTPEADLAAVVEDMRRSDSTAEVRSLEEVLGERFAARRSGFDPDAPEET